MGAGEVDISFGGDQGGSVRIPAAYCGTVGLKPTFGLISHFGMGFGSDQSIDYTGPLTLTVEDTARALQATAGPDGYDPRQSRDVPESMDVLSGLKEGVAGLRIGVLDQGFEDADPEVKDLVLAAVDRCCLALTQASEALRADRDFLLAAVARNGLALVHVYAELRADRDFMLAAVARNGYALQHAAPQLRADREVVLTAVAQNGRALVYASVELRANREVVLAAQDSLAELRRKLANGVQTGSLTLWKRIVAAMLRAPTQ